jgi:zinc protease
MVVLKALGPGGTSLAADSDYVNAALAASVVQESGIGDLSLPDLQKLLRRTAASVSVTPFIGDLNQGVTGHASTRDVETMLQLAYLAFTAPRADSARLVPWRERLRAGLATGQAQMTAAIRRLLTRNDPHARPITAQMVDSLDPARAVAFYSARFADASNFTFYIVGAFDVDSLRPLVERWIGGLPSTHAHETWRDLGVRPIPGPSTINANVAPPGKTTMQLAISGAMSFDAPETVVLDALGQIAQRRLLQRLRSELHATYGVQLSTAAFKYPWEHYEIDVNFDAAPEQADSLAAVAIAVLDTLRENGPTAEEVADMRALEARGLETSARNDGYWADVLARNDWNGWDRATGLAHTSQLVDAVTVERIRDAARKYLDTARVVRIAIRPAGAAGATGM